MSTYLNSIIWLIAAVFISFSVSMIFSGLIKLSRRVFLIPYITISSAFLFAFFCFNFTDLKELLTTHWLWGLIAGIIAGAFLVSNVFSQPNSRTSKGWNLLFDIVWMGLAYGIIDALLLNVIPVLIIWETVSSIGWIETWAGKIMIGSFALVASLLITFVYHMGYTEFRNKKMLLVLFGNSLITLAFIVSGNPLGAIISHTAMHIAAVIRGPETTIQLPPHGNN